MKLKTIVSGLGVLFLCACNGYVYVGHHDHGWDGPHRGWHHGWGQNWGRASFFADNSVSDLAADYEISEVAAAKIIHLASGKDTNQALAELQVTQDEMSPLAHSEMPSDSTVVKLSASLNEDAAKVRLILSDFISDTKN